MRRFRLTAALLGFVPAAAYAQKLELIPGSGMIGSCNFVTGEFHYACFPLYLGYLIQLAFAFGVGTCLTQIIWGGYEYAITPAVGGDNSGAKTRIRHAIIGLIVCILSFLIVDTIVLNLLSGPSNL